MNHVMLDLETMGFRSKSAIVSIGAVAFDPDNNVLGDTFYTNVDLNSCLDAGLEIDGSTIMWWLDQSEAAKNSLQSDQLPLQDALSQFSDYIHQFKNVKVWGNGASFDNVIMENAYLSVNMERPWRFYQDRDQRTIVDIVDSIHGRQKREKTGTAHNALDDAVNQAKLVCKCWQMLGMKKK